MAELLQSVKDQYINQLLDSEYYEHVDGRQLYELSVAELKNLLDEVRG
ncbi:Fur-regulated basic protein FbpA [Aureibacillus halotolerans]|uniref:Fur-regulated basic protein A n=1 Tax=Aureibacillus halotolerans TaxID=1508390 RepID=A0A4R6TQM8_9BACI|nr:Fur-regulated basic protein FbpA [Aureibacillus halotolerans]TDQ35249.1 Fur-regulated basic protein A [Aureibacillus halotolerans]